ncbi:MAG: acetyltransferase [Pseudomonadota bacterium]
MQVVMLGGGGHARVVADLLSNCRTPGDVSGYVDPHDCGEVEGLPYLGPDSILDKLAVTSTLLANGIGSLPRQTTRKDLYERYSNLGFRFPALVHRKSTVAASATLADGVQIMAGGIVQPATQIGNNTIVNTGAIVDHDCLIGPHAHIAPGAVLNGGVTLDAGVHIGTGARVLQGVHIGENAIIGVGASVRKNVPKGAVVFGAEGYVQDPGDERT